MIFFLQNVLVTRVKSEAKSYCVCFRVVRPHPGKSKVSAADVRFPFDNDCFVVRHQDLFLHTQQD